MRQFLCIALLLTGTIVLRAQSQIDSIQFFMDEQTFNVTLTTDVSKLLNEKMKEDYNQSATIGCKLPDSSDINEAININVRGHSRRSICYMPPLRLNFHNATSPTLFTLNSLKLVCPCRTNATYEQYLLKEFLIYKMYNLLTERSFRVRLLNLTLKDSKGKKKPFTQYAFLMESPGAMAKRNNCKEFKGDNVYTESTDRQQMTIVAVFEYMIGNTDWAVPNQHNIKLIYSKNDSSNSRPYSVPYDFDYSGLVNTDYAIPTPELGIENVRQRLYRGFPRTMDELQDALKIFIEQKEKMYSLINNFEPLSSSSKKEMISYLDEFYKMINNPKNVEIEFVQNARKQ